MDQLFQAVSNILLQVNHTNQALLNFLSTGQHQHRSDSKVRPKSFSGLPSEDVLMWLDHLENVAGYHLWTDDRKAMEVRTLLDNVAATWYIQQPDATKANWQLLKAALIQSFAHQNIMQTALQQLTSLKQQPSEPVAQFAVKLNQLLLRADPAMSEEMKLFFLWPRLRHDISRRVRDQGPVSFHAAIQIAQRIEVATCFDSNTIFTTTMPTPPPRPPPDSTPVPMDIDVQNALATRRALPERDANGRPKCFYCNNYGHIKKYCRKFKATQQHQHQNAQVCTTSVANIQLTDAASLAELLGNL